MFQARGERHWFIPDGFIPPDSTGELISHESVCVLNTSSEDALIRFTIFFEDREPMEDILVVVKGRRTKHIRTSSLMKNGAPIPIGVPYAIELSSDIPIVVQYSRLDSTQAENTLMSTMAYPIK
ncbi:hypothetical protein KP806_06685 [Paenibacillus sp. N4]|uniref:sensory rhodopsin transducer n=1 Tax=Paenibacillus vietnamensis TaxID=2590547 RepID=UPI001CD060E9|nr:sensory rhodopsin transducer [Paenibacillus vietnamensis]MCA0754732.1 hypothetical protein [Paenibacillus vietnamensis]